MNLFGMFGKGKVVSFPEFREVVRGAVRKAEPTARMEPTEKGFHLRMDGKPVMTCNLQNLYNQYSREPGARDALIQNWLDTLIVDIPDHTWGEAQTTLRPMLKTIGFVESARRGLAKLEEPDDLPSEPFAGDLHAIVMREVSGTLTAVTRNQLEKWGIGFDEVTKKAMLNMGMLAYPICVNDMTTGGDRRGNGASTVGLVFEQDFLTASWLLADRFRDHLSMRLQRDYIVAVPNRGRLIAVRSDEPGLIATVLSSNKNIIKQAYPLTSQCYHISAASTGGTVTVYKGNPLDTLNRGSVFAGDGLSPAGGAPAGFERHKPVDLSQWSGIMESTDEGE
ncbi:MAG: hypothetical protein H7308_19075 [Chthonomonadaceae bacterium]|nr:hypothetical protein [Chthonomonadaceae bacterium]